VHFNFSFKGVPMHLLTLEELKNKREADLMGSERAIREHSDTFRQIKKMLQEINSRPLDVEDYHRTARCLGGMLARMSDVGGGTIFHYFAEHIDPGRSGDVRCFRLECRDLAEQIRHMEQWRAERHRLKRIK
jgi:hypothetical protein